MWCLACQELLSGLAKVICLPVHSAWCKGNPATEWEKGSCMNSAQSTWREVSVLGAKCGQLIHCRNSIVIVVYIVEACITVPESCKGGKAMRTFLHCSKLSASDSNANARCSFALCHLSLLAEMERRCSARLGSARLSCDTNTQPVKHPSMALPG